jgi:hypothetical protein
MRFDKQEAYSFSFAYCFLLSWEMNQDGRPNPKTIYPRSLHDNAVTNCMRSSGNSKSSLLLTCAKSDKGGGVGLSHVFAIYSTASLPSVWTGKLHAPPDTYVQRLQALANGISVSLPIYTSWDGIRPSPSPSQEHHRTIQPLIISPMTPSSHSDLVTRVSKTQEIAKQKPHFLLNAALHEQHCIIGQGSTTETLLVVLRRPWCVLEICVSNQHDNNTNVLEAMLEFARTAQEFDYAGYTTAVFLLEYELVARARMHCQTFKRRECSSGDITAPKGWWEEGDALKSPRRVYEMCNTVFLPSLKSFNSFWIRLICVSAIELGASFSCMINMLCDRKQKVVFPPCFIMPAGAFRHHARRQSEIVMASFWRTAREIDEHNSNLSGDDIVEKMLRAYKDVLRRTGDFI